MPIKIEIPKKNKKPFRDLEIGETFFDRCGNISIKTNSEKDYPNAITFEKDKWYYRSMRMDYEFEPIGATLVIED